MKKSSKKKKLCKAEGCFCKPAPLRRECFKHRSRRLRAEKPIHACYYTLRMNAKRRKILFSITLPWFVEFVVSTGYMQNKGRLADSLTIDRENNLLGYEPGNLTVITKSANCTKFHKEDLHRELNNELGGYLEGDIPF